LVAIVAVVVLMIGLVVAPAFAETVARGGGSAFGEHVSSMAPERPMDQGGVFGKCLSTMALTGDCVHQ
jgi:hypothetical protein